jgi:2'-5' RNA ligase superfamily
MEPTRSALVVAVPEAEEAVGSSRAALDAAAALGVPAHVTVLYPFLPPARIDDRVLSVVRATVAAVPRFAVRFRHVGWFGETVVWLAPEPGGPFRALTAAIWRRFPETPPYEGAYPDSTPHLTVGHDQPLPRLVQAAEAVSARLPVDATIGSVRLMRGSPEPGSWHTVTEFALGGA